MSITAQYVAVAIILLLCLAFTAWRIIRIKNCRTDKCSGCKLGKYCSSATRNDKRDEE